MHFVAFTWSIKIKTVCKIGARLYSAFFLPKNTSYKTFKLYGNQELLSPGNTNTEHRARWMAWQRTEGKSDNIHTHTIWQGNKPQLGTQVTKVKQNLIIHTGQETIKVKQKVTHTATKTHGRDTENREKHMNKTD